MLVGLGLVSVVLLATVNFVVVRSLLDTSVRDQLVTLRELRRDGIELGIDRLLNRVAVIGQDPAMAQALADLENGYGAYETDLTADEVEQLEASYAEAVAPYDEAGAERPDVDDLVPESTSGQSAQLNYIANNPNPAEERWQLDDAGDGSSYSEAHAVHHQYLTEVAISLNADDLILISADTNDVVYTVEKRIDLGTDVEAGPYADTGLGASWNRLRRSAVTDAVIVDAAFYLPDASRPLVHVGATIRRETQVIGAVVIEFPIDGLTDMITAGQQWDLLGLGETGDAYVVGADKRLRSVPRPWFEGPADYVSRYLDKGGDEESAGLMSFTGSPVLLHEIDNGAINSALIGDDFIGVVQNGLDRKTLTASAPLSLPGLDWIIVTEQQTSETRSELISFLWSTLLLLAILLPILSIVGAALARQFAKPVGPLVNAAREIADEDFDTEIADLGQNELGDLGRQLESVASQLREQDASIAEEEERITAMLESVLPATLVDRVRRGERDVTELVDTATVIALTVHGLPEASGPEQDAVLDLTGRLTELLDLMSASHGIERIRSASDQQMFLAGRGFDDERVDLAVAFASDAVTGVSTIGSDLGIELTVRAGLSAGLVASGVLGRRQLSFGMWGEAVSRAIELSGDEAAGLFVDASVADNVDPDLVVTPVTDAGRTSESVGDVFQIEVAVPNEPAVESTEGDSGP